MIFSTIIDNFIIGIRSAWLARGRGFAVFSGVLLSTMVLSTVLAYSSGLGQVAMQESIKEILFDVTVQFKNEPGYKPETRTNDVSEFSAICDTFVEKPEYEDCGLMFANTGFYPDKYNNQWEATEFSKGISVFINRAESSEIDMPLELMFLDDSIVNGAIGNDYSSKVVDGEWFSDEFEQTSKQIILSRETASKLDLGVGKTIDLTFAYASDIEEKSTLTESECLPITEGATANINYFANNWSEEKEFEACYQNIPLNDLLIIGIYELPEMEGFDGRDSNLSRRHLLTTASIESVHINELMRNDYAVLGLKMDRSFIPSNSIDAAKERLTDLEDTMQGTPSRPVKYGEIEIRYQDNIRGLLSGLTWFLIGIQIFDYVLMIPVILLSLAVLLYGLNLALEQRRGEIAIHRLYGGTSRALLGIILTEVFIISVVGWILGYIIGIFSARYVLDAIGFMEFGGEINQFDLKLRISIISTAVIFVVTVGLAMIVAWVKTKKFLSIEIEEGIKKETKPKMNKVMFLINILIFGIGIGAVVVSIINPNINITYGALYIFGPFLLWIGGANVLGKVSGYGPRLASLLLGKTPLLKDVKIGIRSSELNRSMNQLGLIVILTTSIVTMAVFQGYTGSLVDERSAEMSAGADMQINLAKPMYESEVKELLASSIDKMSAKNTFAPKALASLHKDKVGIKDQRYTADIVVVSKNHRQVLNWHDQTFQQGFGGLSNLSNLGFTSGSNAARKLDLAVQSSGETINNIFSGFDSFERDDEGGFDFITMVYPSESQNQKSVTVSYQGGHKWIPGRPQSILADSVVLIEESTFRTLNGNEDYKAKDWFVEFCDEKSKNCGDYLKDLTSQIIINNSVVSAKNWQEEYDEVKRNGGLIFGTPGILSLQYVVAVFATLASSVVFLSLILGRRRRELAILQSIGASVSQLSRLVIFEVISVFTFSLLLGGILGLGLAKVFTGLFGIFGGLFQLVLGSEVVIARELVWPWTQLLIVNGLIFALVFLALFITTFRAIRSDLPTVLKEE